MKEKTKNKKPDIKALEAELKVLREELSKKDDYQDNFLRLQAEFDNFRKRSAKERQEFIKYANESMVLELIGMLDNFERSIKAADEKQDFKLLHQGVDMISKELHKLLSEKGLKKIVTAGEKFDPHKHEAFELVELEEAEDGEILEEFQAGYMLNDHIIRTAKVKVAKKKEDLKKEEEIKEEDIKEEKVQVEEQNSEEETDPEEDKEDLEEPEEKKEE